LSRSGHHFLAFVDKLTDKHAVEVARAAEERATAALEAAKQGP